MTLKQAQASSTQIIFWIIILAIAIAVLVVLGYVFMGGIQQKVLALPGSGI